MGHNYVVYVDQQLVFVTSFDITTPTTFKVTPPQQSSCHFIF